MDQNYDILEKEDGTKLRKKHVKQFGRRALSTQKEIVDESTIFNNEELYLLNRIMFKLMKDIGSTLRFDVFCHDVNTLQTGAFEDSLRLWLNCICELEEDIQLKYTSLNSPRSDASENKDVRAKIISKTKFNNVIRSSFPQDTTKKTSFEIVVDTIFSGGLDDYKSLESIHSFILNNLQARNLIYCVL